MFAVTIVGCVLICVQCKEGYSLYGCWIWILLLGIGWCYGARLLGERGMGGSRGTSCVFRMWWRYMRVAREFRVGVEGRR